MGYIIEGKALNKGEVGVISKKKFPYGQQNGNSHFFLGTEKEEKELKELMYIYLFIYKPTAGRNY